MIVTCEACGTSYTLKAGLLNPSGSMVRCSNCQHVFMVSPETTDAQQPADAAAIASDAPAGVEYTLSDKAEEEVVETEKELDAIFAEDEEDAFNEDTDELAATVEALDLLEEEEEEDDWFSEVGPELEEFDREIRRTTQDSDDFFEDEEDEEAIEPSAQTPDEAAAPPHSDVVTPDITITDITAIDTPEEPDIIGLDDLSTQTVEAGEEVIGLDALEGGSEAGYDLLTETAEGESVADYELLTETAEGESVADYELLTETAEGESATGYDLLTETAEGESVADYNAGYAVDEEEEEVIGLETLTTSSAWEGDTHTAEWEGDTHAVEWEGETVADIDSAMLKSAEEEEVIGLDMLEGGSVGGDGAGYDLLTETAEGESVTSYDAGAAADEDEEDIIGLETLETPAEWEGDTHAVEWEGETVADIDSAMLKTVETEEIIGLDMLEGGSVGGDGAGYDLLTETAEGESVTSYDADAAAGEDEEDIIGLETLETPAEWEGETVADIDSAMLKTVETEEVIGLDVLEGRSEAGYELLTETAEGQSAAGYELLTETAEGESAAGYDTAAEEDILGIEDIGELTVDDGELLDIDEEEFNLDDILAEEDALAEQEAAAEDIFEVDGGVQPDDIKGVEQREIETKGGLLAELADEGKKPDSKKPRLTRDEKPGDEEFDLDLEEEAGEAAETLKVDDSDLGLDLDLDEFDLDLVDEQETPVTGAKEEEEEFDLDLEETAEATEAAEESEEEEFDLDLDLGETAEAVETPAQEAEDEFDLDFDAEGVTVEGEEEPAAETLIAGDDFDLEETAETTEAAEGSEEEEFDLDLDLDLGETAGSHGGRWGIGRGGFRSRP
ncbi:MAG: hypothetical protein GXP53_02225 [Deltaproteobacteria bacterium]|nr:hypothetical protein [Deltaproteobacteria bacterium]